MSNWRRSQKYRQPDRKERNKIFFTGYQLGELFSEEEIADLVSTARQRVIGEFFYATERNPRYRPGSGMKARRGTDNYICELSIRPSELARYVLRKMHRTFVTRHQLPGEMSDLPPKLIEMVIQQTQYNLILLAVNTMRQRGEVWYDEALGIWQVRQSSVDEFLEFRRVARSVKVDDRSWHGRPSRDRGAIPEGVSVSFA